MGKRQGSSPGAFSSNSVKTISYPRREGVGFGTGVGEDELSIAGGVRISSDCNTVISLSTPTFNLLIIFPYGDFVEWLYECHFSRSELSVR